LATFKLSLLAINHFLRFSKSEFIAASTSFIDSPADLRSVRTSFIHRQCARVVSIRHQCAQVVREMFIHQFVYESRLYTSSVRESFET
jgi:hypothetical protein